MRWSEVAPRARRLGRLAPGTVAVDPDRLRSALEALVEDAIKDTRADAIELRATSDGTGQLRIEVEDEGCRVHEDALARIFDRFARAGPPITERPASRSAPTGAKLLERMDIDLAGVQGAVRDQRRRRHDTPPHS